MAKNPNESVYRWPRMFKPGAKVMHCIRRKPDMDSVTGKTLLIEAPPYSWKVQAFLCRPGGIVSISRQTCNVILLLVYMVSSVDFIRSYQPNILSVDPNYNEIRKRIFWRDKNPISYGLPFHPLMLMLHGHTSSATHCYHCSSTNPNGPGDPGVQNRSNPSWCLGTAQLCSAEGLCSITMKIHTDYSLIINIPTICHQEKRFEITVWLVFIHNIDISCLIVFLAYTTCNTLLICIMHKMFVLGIIASPVVKLYGSFERLPLINNQLLVWLFNYLIPFYGKHT